MMHHLILYDGECGLCDRTVQWVISHDTEQLFAFAPLQGTTAAQLLPTLPPSARSVDSILLLENFKGSAPRLSIYSKAIFRICWLLGGRWSIPGLLAFSPSCLYDWAYRAIAKRRYRLFPQRCPLPMALDRHRFLP